VTIWINQLGGYVDSPPKTFARIPFEYAQRALHEFFHVSTEGLVEAVTYLPSVADNLFRCPGFPLFDGGVANYQPFDSFVATSFEDSGSRFDPFASQLQETQNLKGYVIVYSSKVNESEQASEYAKRARSFLIGERKIPSERIVAMNGGRREEFTVELFLIPNNWNPPMATPTLSSDEVIPIKQHHEIFTSLSPFLP
jgi:hypothetical protein